LSVDDHLDGLNHLNIKLGFKQAEFLFAKISLDVENAFALLYNRSIIDFYGEKNEEVYCSFIDLNAYYTFLCGM
jgi:hypothetical protein